MGTLSLFGETRSAVLGLFFRHPDEPFHLRQVIRRTGAGTGAVQRELAALTAMSILTRTARGNQTIYALNPACPILAELRGLILKTTGLAEPLRGALAPLAGGIRCAFIYGSFARGEHDVQSDVDVMVIGEVEFNGVCAATHDLQIPLGREINPTVYRPDEFAIKIAGGHRFLNTVYDGAKVFLIGDAHELAGLAGREVADGVLADAG
jgi:uncharacterized protein